MKLAFFMKMKTPTTTFQAKKMTVRNGKPVIYDSPEAKKVKSLLLGHLQQHAPEEPMEGDLKLSVIWCYQATDNHFAGEFRGTKPDIDNLQKLLMDCMTKQKFWDDDSQVVILNAMKVWADVPGIRVEVEELNERN